MLRGISVKGVDFITELSHLSSLDFMLGGTNNLPALAGMVRIQRLGLCQVRSLTDISVISTLTGLEFLALRSLARIQALPDLSRLRALRRVCLEDMKGLTDIRPLEQAPALEELVNHSAVKMDPTHYAGLLKSKTLKGLSVGFGSTTKNEILKDMATRAGIKESQLNASDFE